MTAYADEVGRLSALGCTYLQLDDTSLAYVNDPAQREHILAIGGDPEHLHETYIENINRALAGRPDGLAVTTHMCRGNAQSMWAAEGSYDFVAEALFSELEVAPLNPTTTPAASSLYGSTPPAATTSASPTATTRQGAVPGHVHLRQHLAHHKAHQLIQHHVITRSYIFNLIHLSTTILITPKSKPPFIATFTDSLVDYHHPRAPHADRPLLLLSRRRHVLAYIY